MSKGSKQRPTDKQLFDANYEDIDWRRWSEHSDGIDPKLTDDQINQLLEVVKEWKTKGVDNEMDTTQD